MFPHAAQQTELCNLLLTLSNEERVVAVIDNRQSSFHIQLDSVMDSVMASEFEQMQKLLSNTRIPRDQLHNIYF